ncbi:MAG: RNA polymerase sigma factor RpoD/SigA [bacterium]|nr:RNA polymerase sigma factor RpoD/SigA [bacterium]
MNEAFAGIKSYLGEISKFRVLTKEEEFELFERLRNGDETVRERIVKCNLRLVVRLAQRFLGKGLSLEDLVQEGNIGLMDVIDRFDHTLGFRFSTYAAFWIRQAIQVAVRKQGSLIRLPVRKARQLGRMSEIFHEYQCVHGRLPTADELAERLDCTVDQIVELLQISRTSMSLDSPLGDEDGVTLQDYLADPNARMPSDDSMRQELNYKLQQVLAQLSERETSILQLRFGLAGRKARSLRNISRKIGLSQEGVRRVEQRALAKLSRPHMRRQLAGLI